MTIKNKSAKRSKISEKKTREIIKLFSFDLDAAQITKITALNRNTVNRYLTEIRIRISEYCQLQSPFSGEIEVDESYFGARRVKGKRGRGAQGKTMVFRIFKRNGKVYTEIVPDCRRATLQAVIRGKVKHESTSTVMAGKAITGWLTSTTKSIFESIMDKMSLSVVHLILMELNLSDFLKPDWLASVEYINLPLFYI